MVSLLGGGHGAIFGDLLLRTASSRELVVVLELAEALRNALRREPGLGVVVPALNKSFTHHLDALQRAQREQLWWGQSPPKPVGVRVALVPSEVWGGVGGYSHVSWRCFMVPVATVMGPCFFFKKKPHYNIFSTLVITVIAGHIFWYFLTRKNDALD